MDKKSLIVIGLIIVIAVVMALSLIQGPVTTDRPTVPSTTEQSN